MCIPTHNADRFLNKAIQSVLRQDYQDFDLVVCDNASTDGTKEICRALADPRVRYVRFEELVGQAANWNRCLELAAGEYVVLLHADDELLPSFLNRAVPLLDSDRDAGLLHCTVQHVDPDGAPLFVQKLYDTDRVAPGDQLLSRLLLQGCVVNPAGVMVRASVYKAVGKFTEAIVWGVDWHMWMRIALLTKTAYVAEPLAIYRQHPQSGTSGVMATARNGKDEAWMMRDIFDRIPRHRPELHALYSQAISQVAHRTWCFAEEMCQRGYMHAARLGIERAVEIRPTLLFTTRVWALWAATYLGYGWFERMHERKRTIGGKSRIAHTDSRSKSGAIDPGI